jgi:hypothetical protein
MTRDPAARDALALINCELRGDKAGANVLLEECDLQKVAKFLAYLMAGALRRISDGAPAEELAEMTGKYLLEMAEDDS